MTSGNSPATASCISPPTASSLAKSRQATEPGLILTPPGEATAEDDGYLSASEVAALKLDADWVILSACNTAAGGAQGAEALSGLARAFFYAGARALARLALGGQFRSTVKLITKTVSTMAADKIGWPRRGSSPLHARPD